MPYYVVWKGFTPGIYESWDACEVQTKGFKGAKYKKFKTRAEAEAAYAGQSSTFISTGASSPKSERARLQPFIDSGEIITPSLAVDAACSGNPGKMEYRGVDTESGKVIFKRGPFSQGTNNIGEFLAIVEGLQLLVEKDIEQLVIYTDSRTATGWVKSGYCNSQYRYSKENPALYGYIKRAEEWLKANTPTTDRILKWNTERWGEIPADYGRK